MECIQRLFQEWSVISWETLALGAWVMSVLLFIYQHIQIFVNSLRELLHTVFNLHACLPGALAYAGAIFGLEAIKEMGSLILLGHIILLTKILC
jgi:hypothetical protein